MKQRVIQLVVLIFFIPDVVGAQNYTRQRNKMIEEQITKEEVSAAEKAVDIKVVPSEPTEEDSVRLVLSGTWQNSCFPHDPAITLPQDRDFTTLGNEITIDLSTPSPPCLPAEADWEERVELGKLSPGTYTVIVNDEAETIGEDSCEVKESPATISGKVSTEDGQLGRGTEIIVYDNNYTIAHDTTDKRGNFTIEISPGTYDVVADKEGYPSDREKNVEVGPGKKISLGFLLLEGESNFEVTIGETNEQFSDKEVILEDHESLKASLVEMNGNEKEIDDIDSYLKQHYDTEIHNSADQNDLTYAETKIRTGEDAYKDMLHITAEGNDNSDVARMVTASGKKLAPLDINTRGLLANFVFLNIDYSAGGDHFDGTDLPSFPAITIRDFLDAYSFSASPNAVFGWKGEISNEAKEAFADEFYHLAIEERYYVYYAAKEAEGFIQNQYPNLPDWRIAYNNGYGVGEVFLKPRTEDYGAVIGYLTRDPRYVTVPDPIEVEGYVYFKCPDTEEEREIREEDLEEYCLKLLDRDDGRIVYRVESDNIELFPQENSTDFTAEFPTEKVFRPDHYKLQFEMVSDLGVSRGSIVQVVICSERMNLNICSREGGVVSGDILSEGDVVEDFTSVSICESSKVELKAQPNPGMHFWKWEGDVAGDNSALDIEMDSDKEVEAHFLEDLNIPESAQVLQIKKGDEVGETYEFTAEAKHEDGSIENVTDEAEWTSSDPEVAKVDDGEVEAHDAGTATIIAEVSEDLRTRTSVKVELVDPLLQDLDIPTGSQTLKMGERFQFTAEAKHEDGSIENVTDEAEWTSSDPEVAKVGGGLVHALGNGSTTIYANYEGKNARVSVTVVPPTNINRINSSIRYLRLSYEVTCSNFASNTNKNRFSLDRSP